MPDLGGLELGDQGAGFGKRLFFLLALVAVAVIGLILSNR